MFDIVEVSFGYGHQQFLKKISYSFSSGQFVALLGANGSGKSTLLRLCAGLLKPSSGEIRSRSKRSFLGHLPGLYGDLTVQENLRIFEKLLGPSMFQSDEWEIGAYLFKRVRELSKGQMARVSLSRAFFGAPEALFFDEPTSSLDDTSASLFLANLKRYLSESCPAFAVVATHDIARISPGCSTALLLDGGALSGDELTSAQAIDLYRARNR